MSEVNINQYFLNYLLENKLLFLFYISLLFTYPIHRVVLPKYYGMVVSNLNKSFNNNQFISNVKMLIFIYALIQVLYTLMHKMVGLLVPNFSEYAIQRIFSHLLQNKQLNYENLEVGEILAKVIKVPNIIYKYLDLLRYVVFAYIMIMIASMIHYSSISARALCVFVFLIACVTLLQVITYYGTMGVEIEREKEKDSVYQHFQDVLNNLISVIVCKQENYEKKVLHEKFQPFIDVFHRSLNINVIFRLIFSVFNVVSFILMNYVIYDEFRNSIITKEKFISSFIVTYSILQLFSEANHSVRSMVDMYSQVKDMENYFNHLSEEESENKIKEDASFKNGKIVFKNVTYQYSENSEFKGKYAYALKNINISIKENENVAIIGQIGSGKSTLVKLLLKFFEPTSGSIEINNIKLRKISRDNLYDHVFYIPQKPKLLNRTLYENIFYGFDPQERDKEENIERVKDILKDMQIEENIIDIFMEKMDQNLGNDGIRLSGGQRQMVWIIRAMLRNTDIIIFDEPTSALDKKNKENIIRIIKEIGKNKTIIIISHDDVDDSFRKIVMKQGEVQGPSEFHEKTSWNMWSMK